MVSYLMNNELSSNALFKNLFKLVFISFFLLLGWSFLIAPAYCMNESDAQIIIKTSSTIKEGELSTDFYKMIEEIIINLAGPESATYTSFASQHLTSVSESNQASNAVSAFNSIVNDWLNFNGGPGDDDDPNKRPYWFKLVNFHYQDLPRAWVEFVFLLHLQVKSGLSPIDFMNSLKQEINIDFIFNQVGKNPDFVPIIDIIKNPNVNNPVILSGDRQSVIPFFQYLYKSYKTNPGVFLQGFHNVSFQRSPGTVVDLIQTELGNYIVSGQFFQDMLNFSKDLKVRGFLK